MARIKQELIAPPMAKNSVLLKQLTAGAYEQEGAFARHVTVEMTTPTQAFRVSDNYFNPEQCLRLASFLRVRLEQPIGIDALLSAAPKDWHNRRLVRILQYFLEKQTDAETTARALIELSIQLKPAFWQIFQCQRFKALQRFVDQFRLNCLHELAQQAVPIAPQKLKLKPVNVLKPAMALDPHAEKWQQQRNSLFVSTQDTDENPPIMRNLDDYLRYYQRDKLSPAIEN